MCQILCHCTLCKQNSFTWGDSVFLSHDAGTGLLIIVKKIFVLTLYRPLMMKAMCSFNILGTNYPSMQCHFLGEQNSQAHHSKNLKSCYSFSPVIPSFWDQSFNCRTLNLYFSCEVKDTVTMLYYTHKASPVWLCIAHTGFISRCVPWEVQGCWLSWKWSGQDVCRWNTWHHQESTWWRTLCCCVYCREPSELWGSDHSSRQLLAWCIQVREGGWVKPFKHVINIIVN